MSHYRLFNLEPELWECIMRSCSKCLCHAQKGLRQDQLFNPHTNINVLATSRPSIRYPTKIAKNILVKIWNFFVHIDFVVLDMQEDMKTPLILGRPFLSTTNAHIDVKVGEIKFHINGKEERFAFKPRPETMHQSRMAWEASIKVSISRTDWCNKGINPNGEVQFGGLKIPIPRREVTR